MFPTVTVHNIYYKLYYEMIFILKNNESQINDIGSITLATSITWDNLN